MIITINQKLLYNIPIFFRWWRCMSKKQYTPKEDFKLTINRLNPSSILHWHSVHNVGMSASTETVHALAKVGFSGDK